VKNLPGKGKVLRDWFGLSDFRPGPKFLRDGSSLYLLESVGSTNDFLMGRGGPAEGRLCAWDGWGWRADAPLQLPPVRNPRPGTVVVAQRQTAGHGRQGRIWRDCGGLHLSVVVPHHRAALEQGFSVWLGVIAALVLREDFRLDARLKWPNDIMVRGRKIGGILLQRSGAAGERLVVAGLGLNLSTEPGTFPAELQATATSVFCETGRMIRPGEIGGRIIARVEAELDRFQAEGWLAYQPVLALLDCLLGHDVRLSVGGRLVAGRAVGLDDRGGLVLATQPDGELQTFHSGDAHLLPSLSDAAGGMP
jgi:biotin-[acetyl-CoA-carboxylase] ligase BirA-like protein